MNIAVELFFDSQSETAIRQMWIKLSTANISNFMKDMNSTPHISLAVYDCIDVTRLKIRLSEFAINHIPLSLKFSAIGMFPGDEGVLFLAPAVTEDLLAMHRNYHQVTADWSDLVWPHYRPDGSWFPHCTIAMKLNNENFFRAITLIGEEFNGIKVNVNSVAAVEYPPANILLKSPLGIKESNNP